MKRLSIFLLVFVLFKLSARGQTALAPVDKGSYKRNFIEGNAAMQDFDLGRALRYFLFAARYDSANANINFKIGQCYLQEPLKKHLAESYLELAVKDVTKKYSEDDANEKHAHFLAWFFLGQAYHLDGRLDKAVQMYDQYKTFLDPKNKDDAADILEVAHYKIQVENAERMMQSPVSIKITNLGDSINTVNDEIAPVITADEQVLFFTRAIPDVNGDPSSSGIAYIEHVKESTKTPKNKWLKPHLLSQYINSGHEATINLSPDGQMLIIYRADVGRGDLFYTTFDGSEWSIPIKFGSNINTEDNWEPSACLSREGNLLYFVSDRPGGLGGRDIYRCVKLPNGQWSLAQNVGSPINTEYDEDAPFLGADGITFFFASNNNQSMGGFDILYSSLDENGKFSVPQNMGYPVNTTDDDRYFVATPDNKRFYFSSSHEEIYNGTIHEKGFGGSDIYMGQVDHLQENPLALFKGRFNAGPCDSLPEGLNVQVYATADNSLVGSYRPNRRSGTFSIIIPPGSKYNFSYQIDDKVISSEEVFVPNDISYQEIQKEVNLKPIRVCPGKDISDDTVEAKLFLDIVVLNNKIDRKPVSNANVTIRSKGLPDFAAVADREGKIATLPIGGGKSYEIIGSKDNETSSPVIFNTIGLRGSQTIKKTVYISKLAGEEVEITLDLLVASDKTTMKPAAGMKVKITGTDGTVIEKLTDEKGKIMGLHLTKMVNYVAEVEKDEKVVAKGIVSTDGIRKSKSIEKTIYISGGQDEIPDNAEFNGTCFTLHFKYNMNELDELSPPYKQFLEKIQELKKAGVKVQLYLRASASTVPTRKYKSNIELAQFRGKRNQERIKASLLLRNISEEDCQFIMSESIISGPAYQGDNNNIERYQKFQYLKVCINKEPQK